ncbi:vacuolar protein sorting-associated protein 26C-like [Styela clava]
MAASLDIKLKRLSKIYHQGETVSGVVIVQSKDSLPHQGIMMFVEGVATLTLSSKSVGRLEAMYSSVKPLNVFSHTLEIAKPGKFMPGRMEIAFEFPLQAKGNKVLYETYHGVYVNIQYKIQCNMKRPLLNKDLSKECEILLEYKTGENAITKPLSFTITPGSLQNIKDKTKVPRFTVRGKLDSSMCCITKPFTGEIVVERSEAVIRSIELQLLRVETVGSAEGFSQEATEIQNIEIGTGDVCHGLTIPIYMVFPRLFACPTIEATNFKIEFEVNIVVVFEDDQLIMEKFPIKLTRF